MTSLNKPYTKIKIISERSERVIMEQVSPSLSFQERDRTEHEDVISYPLREIVQYHIGFIIFGLLKNKTL